MTSQAGNDSKVETLFQTKTDTSLSQFASSGALSSSARVGIMLALLGVERITFTDFMLAVNVSKSSLNKSIKILADEGLVKERFGFKATGGPRTFVQITEKGKRTIRTPLETVRHLATKYLQDEKP